jgi:hypothetical protein
MTNISKNYHRLPGHYLNGFTDSKNCFFVYDKQRDKIFPSGPSDNFFENDLNIITLPGGSPTDFARELDTDLENRCRTSLDIIRESTLETPIRLWDKMQLFLFLIYLFWRLPGNNGLLDKSSEKTCIENNDFDNFRLADKTGGNTPKQAGETIKEYPVLNESYAQKAPFIPLHQDKGWAFKLMNWQFSYIEDDKSWYFVGDNPIITKEENDSDFSNCLKEFVFPVSGKIVLVDINKPLTKALPPGFALQYNTAILARSQKFVVCQNKSYLEALIKDFRLHAYYKKPGEIVSTMFEMLK